MPRPAWLIRSTRTNANSDFVDSIAVQADGKILAGGNFRHRRTDAQPHRPAGNRRQGRPDAQSQYRRHGDLELTPPPCSRTARFSSAANFTSVLGVTRNNIARLNTDGTLDTAFNPNANSIVYSIAVQADGKILVGGDFTASIGGQTRNRIARLDATTGLADSFNPNAKQSMSLQSRCRRTARF